MEAKTICSLCVMLISVGLVAGQNSTEASTAEPTAESTTAKPVAPTQAPASTQAPPQATTPPTTSPTTPPPEKGRFIKCYSCVNCDEPFNPNAKGVVIESCSGKCEKNYRSAFTSTVNGTRVDRACDANAKDVVCPPPISLFGWTTVDCYCSTDLCNSAVTPTCLGVVVLTAVHILFSL